MYSLILFIRGNTCYVLNCPGITIDKLLPHYFNFGLTFFNDKWLISVILDSIFLKYFYNYIQSSYPVLSLFCCYTGSEIWLQKLNKDLPHYYISRFYYYVYGFVKMRGSNFSLCTNIYSSSVIINYYFQPLILSSHI